ncbi:hypothetical protein LA02_1242 [Francisella philomiragia]|uniref:DUF4280 domain-containing protein n=1 Tax=Francisella philomiragia TaxID=28110 RepID=UPI0005A567A1|nr:DUF4280 domain-containing protein [Francisella philomiragia]AJI56564.1 hypothetical protein LA02_1242 [Francisella philomiragia]
MSKLICSGSKIKCIFGDSSSSLRVLPTKQVYIREDKPVAVTTDNTPFMNIPPFGNCKSPSNPAVAASGGTPQPCTPMTATLWSPGSSTVNVGNISALTENCKLNCAFGGAISIEEVNQKKVKFRG